MKLESMRRNVLTYTLADLIVKVEEDSIKRTSSIESMSYIDNAKKSKASRTEALTESEKMILKALGLTPKSIKALKGAC